MDTENLVKTIKERFEYDASKQVIKEKYESKLLFAEFGGMWKADPNLIVLLSSLTDEEVVVTDSYGNPCKANREKLLETAKQRYQEQMNAWFHEFNEINRQR